MNTKTAIGILAAIVILVGAFFFFHKPVAAPAIPETSTSSTATTAPSTSSTTSPVAHTGASAATAAPAKSPSAQVVSHHPTLFAAFDSRSLTSSSSHPIITGTANIPAVGIVIDNAQGVGIVGSANIPVTNGKWSFVVPLGLPAGNYTVHLVGGDSEVLGGLTITQ